MSNQDRMETLLRDHFMPEMLLIRDESASHAGHNARARDGGTHFALTLVSSRFEGQSTLQRHRAVHLALKPLLEGTVHALSMNLYSPKEWQDRSRR